MRCIPRNPAAGFKPQSGPLLLPSRRHQCLARPPAAVMLSSAVILHEPVTFLTDCLLAVLATALATRMPATSAAVRWWRGMFACTAVSALVAGCHHGFAHNFSDPIRHYWWIGALGIISGLGACMAMSLLHELVPPDRQRPWRGLVGAKLIISAFTVIMHPAYLVVIIDYGLTMLAWLAAAVLMNRPWRRWILTGFGLSTIAAVVQQSGWPSLTHFNHNDLYHVIQAVGLVALSRASRHFKTE